jgi:hypothetical protein
VLHSVAGMVAALVYEHPRVSPLAKLLALSMGRHVAKQLLS